MGQLSTTLLSPVLPDAPHHAQLDLLTLGLPGSLNLPTYILAFGLLISMDSSLCLSYLADGPETLRSQLIKIRVGTRHAPQSLGQEEICHVATRVGIKRSPSDYGAPQLC